MAYDLNERGPLITYELTWKNGHVERIDAHQVTIPHDGLGSILGATSPRSTPRVMFHGEIDGHWQLILAVPESEVATVRNVTRTEAL